MRALLAITAALFSGPALCACPSAAAWSKSFFQNHYDFYVEPTAAVLAASTKQFGTLLQREAKFSNGEVGHLDYDPWLGAQDGEIKAPVFSLESQVDDVALVSMKYQFVMARTQQHAVHLVLRKEAGCWLLNDLITPIGESLTHAYSKP